MRTSLAGINKVHEQFKSLEESKGYPGEVNDPDDPRNVPPHAERKQVKICKMSCFLSPVIY